MCSVLAGLGTRLESLQEASSLAGGADACKRLEKGKL